MPCSPLHTHHSASGATFTEIAGWDVPLHYGDVAAEHHAVRTAAGLIDLSHRGKVRMSGRDRQGFLHRIVTNDINGLKTGDGIYACLLTPQGKIIADMTVYLREEDILLDTEPGMAGVLQTSLDRYAIIDDVKIEDASERWSLIGLHGPHSASLLHDRFGDVSGLRTAQHRTMDLDGTPVILARADRTGETGYDLYAPADRTLALWTEFLESGTRYGLRLVGHEALETLRVEAGIPRYGADLDDRIIPNEAVKERAVSFNKGCYIGQEPVVMMEHRGKPNRLLTGLKIEGDVIPPHNAALKMDDQEAGWITSAVQGRSAPSILALGFVRRKYLSPGARLVVEIPGATTIAEIAEFPFYRKGS